MKTSMQLQMSQQLTMTPQLQQAIRLLQLSTLELKQEIQEALETNPLLEEFENINQNDNEKKQEVFEKSVDDLDPVSTSQKLTEETIQSELPFDAKWEDLTSSAPVSSNFKAENINFKSSNNLKEHLNWQLNVAHINTTETAIATIIIDSMDENGFVQLNNQQIKEILEDENIADQTIDKVFRLLQGFDPIGVATKDLKETLLVQIESLDVRQKNTAKNIISEHLDLLAKKDYRSLMRKLKIKKNQLNDAINIITKLNPKPGAIINNKKDNYITPDVAAYKKNGKWHVELNPDIMPNIRVNQYYANLGKTASTKDSQFIKGHLQDAKWFLKSIENRNETLLKVANFLVDYQSDFLDYGDEAMKPMILSDVALKIEMHESTVSRVTTNKYMLTPKGIIELKYFFSSHVSTQTGGECSSVAIRAIIKKIIENENPNKPISDSKIAFILEEQGIEVARRTIAKYREGLSIAPSNQRKVLAIN